MHQPMGREARPKVFAHCGLAIWRLHCFHVASVNTSSSATAAWGCWFTAAMEMNLT
jgi:hypothetical protein